MEIPVGHGSFELRVDLVVAEVVPEMVRDEVVDFSECDAIDRLHELDVSVGFLLFPIVAHVNEGPFSECLSERHVLLEVGVIVVVRVKDAVVVGSEVIVLLGEEDSEGSVSCDLVVFLNLRGVDGEPEDGVPALLLDASVEPEPA